MEFALYLAITVGFIAGGIQRITGMGFALVATPVLVVLYGPTEGVRIVVVLGIFASGGLLVALWSKVDWRRALRLTWPGLAVSPLGGVTALLLPETALLLVVAGAAILSLLAGHVSWLATMMAGKHAAIKAGAVGGFLNITSGLSGPPLASYAVASNWSHNSFVASVQIVFIAFDLVTVLWRGLPETPPSSTFYLLAAVIAGIIVSSLAMRFIRARTARLAMFVIAWIGVGAVLAQGITSFFD